MDTSVVRRLASAPEWVARALAGAAALLFVCARVIPSARDLSHGFAAYYTSARLLLDGVDPAGFYRNRWFMEQTIALGFQESPDIFHVNTPATSLIMLPFAWLSPARADFGWAVLNVALLTLAILLLARALRDAGLALSWGSPLIWLLVAYTFIYNPVWENVRYGQVYIALLVLLALAMGAYVRDQDGRFGSFLGLMLFFKSSGTLLWLLPLIERRYRTLAAGVGTILAGIVVSIPLLGLRSWWEYAQWLPSLFDQPWSGVTAYQTTTSLFHHNLKASERYNTQPVLDLPWLAGPLEMLVSIVVVVAIVTFGWALARQLPERLARLVRFGLVAALAIPLQPLGEEYHYTLVLPSVWVALALPATSEAGLRSAIARFLGLSGALLLALPVEITDPWFEPGYRALLAYPKLYGAFLVAGSLAAWLASEPATWPARTREVREDMARTWAGLRHRQLTTPAPGRPASSSKR